MSSTSAGVAKAPGGRAAANKARISISLVAYVEKKAVAYVDNQTKRLYTASCENLRTPFAFHPNQNIYCPATRHCAVVTWGAIVWLAIWSFRYPVVANA
jgi:hypothetical protein